MSTVTTYPPLFLISPQFNKLKLHLEHQFHLWNEFIQPTATGYLLSDQQSKFYFHFSLNPSSITSSSSSSSCSLHNWHIYLTTPHLYSSHTSSSSSSSSSFFDPHPYFTFLSNLTSTSVPPTSSTSEAQSSLAWGSTLLYTECTTSTQSFLDHHPIFKSMLPNGTLFLTASQTQGRGRRSNAWDSPIGSLAFTLYVTLPPLDLPQQLEQQQRSVNLSSLILLQYVTALILAELLNLQLKWPNDLMVNQSNGNRDPPRWVKLGGILITTSFCSRFHLFQLCIGVGLNWSNPSPTLAYVPLLPSLQPPFLFPTSKQEQQPPHVESYVLEYMVSTFMKNFDKEFTSFWSTPLLFFPHFHERYKKKWIHEHQLLKLQVPLSECTPMSYLKKEENDEKRNINNTNTNKKKEEEWNEKENHMVSSLPTQTNTRKDTVVQMKGITIDGLLEVQDIHHPNQWYHVQPNGNGLDLLEGCIVSRTLTKKEEYESS